MAILGGIGGVFGSMGFWTFDYWKIVLVFLVFFVSRDNAVVLLIKLYFLADLIVYEKNHCF